MCKIKTSNNNTNLIKYNIKYSHGQCNSHKIKY